MLLHTLFDLKCPTSIKLMNQNQISTSNLSPHINLDNNNIPLHIWLNCQIKNTIPWFPKGCCISFFIPRFISTFRTKRVHSSLINTLIFYGCIKFVIDVFSLFEDEILFQKLGHVRFDMEAWQMNHQYCSYQPNWRKIWPVAYK